MTQKVLSNKIILGILEEFKANYEFGESSESKLFERLVNYVTLSKYDPEAFSDALDQLLADGSFHQHSTPGRAGLSGENGHDDFQ